MTTGGRVMPPASLKDKTPHELLEAMLDEDGINRALAWVELERRGWGGCTVLDSACRGRGDHPIAMTVTQLLRHLRVMDSQARVTARGHKAHTRLNVEFTGLAEQAQRGPAYAAGGGRR